jgi:hypothetical protein
LCARLDRSKPATHFFHWAGRKRSEGTSQDFDPNVDGNNRPRILSRAIPHMRRWRAWSIFQKKMRPKQSLSGLVVKPGYGRCPCQNDEGARLEKPQSGPSKGRTIVLIGAG